MLSLPSLLGALVPLLVAPTWALNFTIAGGQVFTPGLAIVDAPQPGTPLGGGLSCPLPRYRVPGSQPP